jgi:hypothetical protein
MPVEMLRLMAWIDHPPANLTQEERACYVGHSRIAI